MTRRANPRSTGLAAALTGLTLALCTGAAFAQTSRAERPTYQVGDKWIRSDGTYQLTRIDKDVYVFVAGRGNEVHLSRDLGLARIVADGHATFDVEPAADLSWPLEVGKWGTRHIAWRSALPRPVHNFTGTVRSAWRVEAYEDVRVAAGSFKAFRISNSVEGLTQGPGAAGANFAQITLWYAPDPQRFVKAQANLPGLNFELAGVDRPAAPPAIAAPRVPVAPVPAPPVVARPAPPVVRAPPSITLLEPKPGTLLRGDQATLKIEVKVEGRLKSLVVRGRGGDKTFAPDAKAKAGEPWVVEVMVPLAEGANVVRLEAVDESGSRAAETVTLTRQSLVAIELRGPPGAEVRVNGTRYTLDAQGTFALRLPPGSYQIDASKEGFTTSRESVTLAPGQAPTQKRLALAPLPPPPPPAPVIAAPPADTEAPKIAINYPGPDTKVERDQIVVLGLVIDNIGVDRVQITVNGVEVAQPRDIGVSGRGLPIRVPAALQPGENVIEITATDKAGNVAQVVRTVTRVTPAVAAPPARKVANRWAVVIGVGEYEHKAIPRLRFAARDAQAMYDFLTTKGGYPKQNVLLLTDTTAEKPTLQNIRRALGDFLFRKPGRDDMVLIYYAGHGAPEVDAAGAETDGLSKYLIPRNADPDSLYSTAFPMDEIQKIFARIPSERVVMLLDTCYSGTAGGRTFARQRIRSGNLSDQFLERLTRSRGRVVITASGPNEVALESPDLGHGIFTYYLLEGLAGKADRNGDGLVTVSELYEYVEDQVDRKAREAGGRQRPLMKGEIEGTLPLSSTARSAR